MTNWEFLICLLAEKTRYLYNWETLVKIKIWRDGICGRTVHTVSLFGRTVKVGSSDASLWILASRDFNSAFCCNAWFRACRRVPVPPSRFMAEMLLPIFRSIPRTWCKLTTTEKHNSWGGLHKNEQPCELHWNNLQIYYASLPPQYF